MALPLLLAFDEHTTPTLPNRDMPATLEGLRPGDTVAFLTTETAVPWSVTLQGRYRYASRYNGFWMMQAVINNELQGGLDEKAANLGRKIVSETVADFTCTPPLRIILSRSPGGRGGIRILFLFLARPPIPGIDVPLPGAQPDHHRDL